MDNKEILNKYVKSFRLECHFLLDYADASSGMPIDTYNRAYKAAREELIEALSLNEEILNKIDAIHRTFISKVIELENYNHAEDYIIGVISKL